MSKINISIIVPVYNASKYIQRFYDCISRQTLKNLEVIFVNDCSQDDSASLLESLRSQDDRISVISFDCNRGPMRAREAAYKVARGDFFIFCDVDDGMPDNALQLLFDKARRTQSDIVAGTAQYIKNDGTTHNWTCKQSFGNDSKAVFKSLLSFEYRHNLWAKIYRRELFSNYQYDILDNLNYSEDFWLFYQLVNNSKKLECINDVVYYYYQNSGSSTQQSMSDRRIECGFIARKQVYELLKSDDDIIRYFYSNIQRDIIALKYKGYNHNGVIDKYIKAYGFDSLLTFKGLWRNNNGEILLKLLIKKMIIIIKKL